MSVESPKAQIARVALVDVELCRCCRPCGARSVCKSKALVRLDEDEPPYVDASRCYGCNVCTIACPFGAVYLNHN